MEKPGTVDFSNDIVTYNISTFEGSYYLTTEIDTYHANKIYANIEYIKLSN